MIDRDAARLLGRHVLERAEHRADRRRRAGRGTAHGAGNPEVHDLRLVLQVDHDVLGFQVTVHDARLVRGEEPVGDLFREPQRLLNAEMPFLAQHLREVASLDVRHREVLDAVDFAEIVDAHDVLVRDLTREEQLTLEAAFHFARRVRVGAHFRPNDFESDRDAQLGIPRLVDDAHAAGAKLPQDAVACPERRAGRERTRAGTRRRRGTDGWRGRVRTDSDGRRVRDSRNRPRGGQRGQTAAAMNSRGRRVGSAMRANHGHGTSVQRLIAHYLPKSLQGQRVPAAC